MFARQLQLAITIHIATLANGIARTLERSLIAQVTIFTKSNDVEHVGSGQCLGRHGVQVTIGTCLEFGNTLWLDLHTTIAAIENPSTIGINRR